MSFKRSVCRIACAMLALHATQTHTSFEQYELYLEDIQNPELREYIETAQQEGLAELTKGVKPTGKPFSEYTTLDWISYIANAPENVRQTLEDHPFLSALMAAGAGAAYGGATRRSTAGMVGGAVIGGSTGYILAKAAQSMGSAVKEIRTDVKTLITKADETNNTIKLVDQKVQSVDDNLLKFQRSMDEKLGAFEKTFLSGIDKLQEEAERNAQTLVVQVDNLQNSFEERISSLKNEISQQLKMISAEIRSTNERLDRFENSQEAILQQGSQTNQGILQLQESLSRLALMQAGPKQSLTPAPTLQRPIRGSGSQSPTLTEQKDILFEYQDD